MPDTYGLRSIVAIVPARDMQLSLAFYKALGFQADLYADGTQYAFLHMDGNYIHLRHAGPDEFSANPGGIYMYVDDADSFHARVVATGITVLNSPKDYPWNCREFAISDPDGLLIRIGQTIR
jgi:catechol 2,3-dioxygenase-like lactoylglutathione lyase family enzyme